jgi:hemoglobin
MFSCVDKQMGNSAAIGVALAPAIPAAGNLVMEVDTKTCCISEDEIGLLVDHFYARVRVDPVLGPIFERVLRGEWRPHMETMRDFWSSVMLTSGRYKGAPVPAHLRVKAIEPETFDRWLRLFGETCDELFENEVAEAFRAKAVRIAESLKLALFFRPNPASTRKSS